MLMNTFGWSSATAYNHEGVSQMNGRSDTGEMFTQTDFQNVLNYATEPRPDALHVLVGQPRPAVHPAGQQRHRPPARAAAWPRTRGTSRSSPRSSPAPHRPRRRRPSRRRRHRRARAPRRPGSRGNVYTRGMQVSEGGHQYTAKWWTQGDDPATHHGARRRLDRQRHLLRRCRHADADHAHPDADRTTDSDAHPDTARHTATDRRLPGVGRQPRVRRR